MSSWDHHQPCPGGCGELEDECMTPGCGSPLGSMRITPPVGSQPPPVGELRSKTPLTDWQRELLERIWAGNVPLAPHEDRRLLSHARRASKGHAIRTYATLATAAGSHVHLVEPGATYCLWTPRCEDALPPPRDTGPPDATDVR